MKSSESPSLPGTEDVGVKAVIRREPSVVTSSQKEESKQDQNTERQIMPKTKRSSAYKMQNHTFLDTKSKKPFDKFSFTDNYSASTQCQQQSSRIHKEGEERKAYFHQFSSKRVLPAIGCSFVENDNTRIRRQKSPLNALQDSSNHPEDNSHIQSFAANKENTHHHINTENVDRLKEEYKRMEQKLRDSEASEEHWKAEAKRWKLLAVMDKSTDDGPRSHSACSLLHSHEVITSPVPNTDISPQLSSPSFQLHKCEPPDITGNLPKAEDNQNVNGSHTVFHKEQLDRNDVENNKDVNLTFNMLGRSKLDFIPTNNKRNQNFRGYYAVSDSRKFQVNDDQSEYAGDTLCPADNSLCPWDSHIISRDHPNNQTFHFSDPSSDFFQDTLFDVQTNNAISSDRFQHQTNHLNYQPFYNEMEMVDISVSDAPFSSYRGNEMEDENDHHDGNNNNIIFLM